MSSPPYPDQEQMRQHLRQQQQQQGMDHATYGKENVVRYPRKSEPVSRGNISGGSSGNSSGTQLARSSGLSNLNLDSSNSNSNPYSSITAATSTVVPPSSISTRPGMLSVGLGGAGTTYRPGCYLPGGRSPTATSSRLQPLNDITNVVNLNTSTSRNSSNSSSNSHNNNNSSNSSNNSIHGSTAAKYERFKPTGLSAQDTISTSAMQGQQPPLHTQPLGTNSSLRSQRTQLQSQQQPSRQQQQHANMQTTAITTTATATYTSSNSNSNSNPLPAPPQTQQQQEQRQPQQMPFLPPQRQPGSGPLHPPIGISTAVATSTIATTASLPPPPSNTTLLSSIPTATVIAASTASAVPPPTTTIAAVAPTTTVAVATMPAPATTTTTAAALSVTAAGSTSTMAGAMLGASRPTVASFGTQRASPPRRLPAPRQLPPAGDNGSSTAPAPVPTQTLAHHVPAPIPTAAVLAAAVPPPQPAAPAVAPAMPQDGDENNQRDQQPEDFNAPFRQDEHDPQRAAEYAPAIMSQLFLAENQMNVRPTYMRAQPDITEQMRGVLLDWLVEVHFSYFNFRPETLFLTQTLIDAYLNLTVVMRERLQLVGVTCMLIAAKFEEIEVPKVARFAYLTDDTYTTTEIIRMECRILQALGFQIMTPTPAHFMRRFWRANGSSQVQRALSQYLLELAMQEIGSLRYRPSQLAAASILLSNELSGLRQTWPAMMIHHSRYTEFGLRACVETLRGFLQQATHSPQQAVRRKYQSNVFGNVADRFAL